jgi:hypothetical protein
MKRPLASFAFLLLSTAGSAHALCPNCLGQSSTLSTTLKVVGVFLLVPPAVFFAAAIAIKRLGRKDVDG